MPDQRPVVLRWSELSIWSCIGAAVAIVAVLGTSIAVYDVNRTVEARRSEELRRLQYNAERSAAHIESQLLEKETPTQLAVVRDALWLRRYWSRNLTRQPGRLYAAITDKDGNVVAHTQREHEGRRISLPPDGDGGSLWRIELVETTHDILTSGRRSLDMRVPIMGEGEPLGVYHTGLDATWLEARMSEEGWGRSRFWCFLVGSMCCLLLLSSVAVVRVTRHTARLEHELEAAHTRRVSEMHELVLGIAHEIRNPLNAIRLNLHTIGQVFREEADLSDKEIGTMLGEMTREIERLDNLMREMLGFARTTGQDTEPIDVAEEIQRTIAFLRPKLQQGRVEVHLDAVAAPCAVKMNRTRLRQILLNLLNNAAEALAHGGVIEISIRQSRGQVEIAVADNGPGIPPPDRERIFIPFFSTKASGTGLGLALARKFVEEARGTIACEDGPAGKGCRFRVLLPAHVTAELEAVP
jgi:two-component system sensor histidine kinase HydH